MLKARFSSGLLLMCLSGTVSFSMSGAEMGAVITSVAKQGQQFQAQSKQFDDQKKVHKDALNQTNVAVNQQASNLNMTSPYGTGATPPTANPGYPLVDQYTNPQYWQQRGHQFKFSMDVASKRSESMNNLAKIELEQQKKKDQMMTEALGTIMNTIGSTIEQQAKDKAAQAKKDAEEAAATNRRNALSNCQSSAGCTPVKTTGGYTIPGEGDTNVLITQEEALSIRNHKLALSALEGVDGFEVTPEGYQYGNTAYSTPQEALAAYERQSNSSTSADNSGDQTTETNSSDPPHGADANGGNGGDTDQTDGEAQENSPGIIPPG